MLRLNPLTEDFFGVAMILPFTASATGYSVFALLTGWTRVFRYAADYLLKTSLYVLLGLPMVCKHSGSQCFKPAIGGFIVSVPRIYQHLA